MNRLTFIFLLLGFVISLNGQNNRINYNGQELFLNGTNLAWIDFANDIGSENVDFERFGKLFKEIHDFGGNSVRLWLHTNGTTTPEFNADTVVGPGVGAIDDLKQVLDSAYKYDVGLILCLWSFDMLRLNIGEPYLARNRKILEEDAALNSYIEYALKPMVDATKNHPAIIAWEVINEPEGMITEAHWGGWSDIGHVTYPDVQRLINRVAGAIHKIDADLQVTSGTHSMYSLTDKEGGIGNYYSDEALINVGGDTEGYLDFYQVHHYEFPLNPFKHNCKFWELDKPLLMGEFHPGDSDLGEFSNYETLIDSGYAGAMGWMWLDSYASKIKKEVQYLFLNRTTDVDIDNMLGDTPALYFEGPESGSSFESGSDIDFTAEATDTDGLITKIEFILYQEQVSHTVLFVDTEAPFEFKWQNPDDGNYSVYAVATDNDGYTKVSDKIIFTIGDPPRYRYEAEEAALQGAEIKSHSEASNGNYVDFYQDGNSITWTIPNCPAAGSYDMILAYGVFYGEKNNFIVVNGDADNQIDWAFTGNSDDWQRDTLSVNLQEGVNTITILPSWGWMQFDFIAFPFARIPYVKTISLSTQSGNNYIDELSGTLQMLATYSPDEASYYPVEWSVDKKALASINEEGVLTAKANGVVTVKASATDGSGVSGEMEITISKQGSGIAQSEHSSLKLYPNPVINELHIDIDNNVEMIEIFNIQGILMDSFLNKADFQRINVSAYKEGVYYLSVHYLNNSKKVGLFVKAQK